MDYVSLTENAMKREQTIFFAVSKSCKRLSLLIFTKAAKKQLQENSTSSSKKAAPSDIRSILESVGASYSNKDIAVFDFLQF